MNVRFSVEAYINKQVYGTIDSEDHEVEYEELGLNLNCSIPCWCLDEYFDSYSEGEVALQELLADKPEGEYHIYAEGNITITPYTGGNPDYCDEADVEIEFTYSNVTDMEEFQV